MPYFVNLLLYIVVPVNKTDLLFTVICFAIVLILCSVYLGIHLRSEMLPQQPTDYELGQVSGSLFQKDSTASATPLSALFGSAAPAAMLVFHPPAEVSASTSTEVKKKKPAEVSSQQGLTCKRKNKIQSKAEKRLEGRSAFVLHPPV